MILFMTSSPCDNNVPEGVCLPCVLNAENGFVDRLEKDWQPDSRCVIICADPDNYDRNNEMAETFQSAFQYHGLTICDMKICDSRKADEAGRMVQRVMLSFWAEVMYRHRMNFSRESVFRVS